MKTDRLYHLAERQIITLSMTERRRKIDRYRHKIDRQRGSVNRDKYTIQLAERQIMTSLMTDQKKERPLANILNEPPLLVYYIGLSSSGLS